MQAITPPTATLPPAIPRFSTVDVLRGLSILAVVLHHTWLRFLFAGYPMQRLMPRPWWHILFRNGGNGVTVFFAISGFLITLTSLRRFGSLASLRPKIFYRIRFARIVPLLTLLVAVLSALALAHVHGFEFSAKKAPLWRAVLSAFTFHLNWLEARFGYLPANWDVLWSLSIEEAFYLVFPLACFLFFRLRRGGLACFVALLGVLVLLGPFARGTWYNNPIWQEKSYLGGTDAIALGCLTALLTYHLAATRRLWTPQQGRILLLVQALGTLLLILTAWGPAWYWKIIPGKQDWYGSLLALGTCAVMLASVLRRHGHSPTPAQPKRLAPFLYRFTAPLRWYGRHSYEVYLTHEFLVVWVAALFLHLHPNANPQPNGIAPVQPSLSQLSAWFFAVLCLTAPLGWAVSRFLSEPLNRVLRGARPAGAASAAAPLSQQA